LIKELTLLTLGKSVKRVSKTLKLSQPNLLILHTLSKPILFKELKAKLDLLNDSLAMGITPN